MKSLMLVELACLRKRGAVVFNIAIFILGILCMGELASAQTPKNVVDDFNDGILDSAMWEVCSSDSSRYMIERNGRLEIHSAGVELSGHCYVMANSQVLLPVNQDFYVKVSFNAADCDDNSGMGLFLRNARTDSKCFIDEGLYIANGNEDPAPAGVRQWIAAKTIDFDYVTPPIIERTSAGSGTFYITNKGGTFYVSYRGFGQENAFAAFTTEDWNNCTEVFICLVGWSPYQVLSGSGSYFDNFSLNVGTFAYDDFNDSIIDNKIWIQLGSFPERYVVETNDRLELRADGSEDDSGGLRTKFLLPIAEDFRAEVFFNSSECTSNSGMLLMVNNANDPDEPPGEYVYIANGAIDGKRVWIAGKAVWHEGLVYEKTEETAVDSGRLFITNHGGIFHLSYEGYGAQNAFATVNIEGWMDCTQISITIGGWTAYEALSGKGSYLDNFLLTGSEVVCTQRPAMDFNDDCKVDFKDLAIFMQSWLECNLVPPEACWQ